LHRESSNSKKVISFIKAFRSKGLLICRDIIRDIHVHPKTIRIRLDATNTARSLGVNADELSDELIEFEAPWIFKRRGVENRIIIGDAAPEPDQTLIRNLATAHQWVHEMKAGTPLGQIALKQGVTPAYIRTRSRLAFLSPKIQQSIIKGSLPPMFTTNRILQMKIPLDWRHQDTLFGI
jgi:site-specific DNA recombinase